MEEKLRGRRALVTGGARRLGREFCLALARAGCDVIVHYRSSEQPACELVNELNGEGVQAVAIQADLSDAKQVFELADRAAAAFGGLDIVVNNASTYADSDQLIASHDYQNETLEEWERSLAVNARAPFFLVQRLIPVLRNGNDPTVVNILDKSVSLPYRTRAAHSISKSALLAVTRMMSISLAPQIRANAIEFGAILPGDEMPEAELSRIEWGGVADAVSALMFILTTSFVRGEVIGVKGNSVPYDG